MSIRTIKYKPVSKYKTEASILSNNIRKRKAKWGIECYDLMIQDEPDQEEIDRKFGLVKTHVQKLEDQLQKVTDKINGLNYGKQDIEKKVEGAGDDVDDIIDDLDETKIVEP